MTAFVILNPYSGRWKALERKPEVENALQAAGIQAQWAHTNQPGDGERLAEQAVLEGFSPILAAGGDGTIGEVVNGMMRAEGPTPPLGVLPIGTANDLACNLGLPLELSRTAQVIKTGASRKMDLCQVNGRFFVNNAGLGLEPYITILQAKMTRLRGNLRYMVAALQGILHRPEWKMQLEWDGGAYNGPITLVSVGNCPRTGGVFYTVPHANPYDGKLTFIFSHLPTRLKILRALPMTLQAEAGNISEHPAVREIHATWLKVRAETPTPAHADGEIFSEAIQELEYRVFPERLRILLPAAP